MLTALPNLVAVAMMYSGLGAAIVGAVSVLKPLRFAGIHSRAIAAAVIAGGVALIVCGVLVPAPLVRIDHARSDLDRAMPQWQFQEVHRTHVDAPPDRVYRAIHAVTADEILLFRTLTWIRQPRVRAPARTTILSPAAGVPILDVATQSGFRRLSERDGRELVLATMVGRATASINFLVEPAGAGGSELSTETRVLAPDARARRGFAAYWRVIYPGSALIRRMWLRAIKQRAELPDS